MAEKELGTVSNYFSKIGVAVIDLTAPLELGDEIRVRSRFHDKWIKRNKRYLTYLSEYINQDDKLVAKWWITLILPQSEGEDLHQF